MFSKIKFYMRYSMAFILIPGVCPIYTAIWLMGTVLIKPFSKSSYTSFHNYLYASYQKYLVFFFEYFSGSEVILYGDWKEALEKPEKVVYFSNHQCLLDWISMGMLAERQDSSKFTRFILKDSLKYIPFYGFHFKKHGYIYIKRGYGFQQESFTKQLQQYSHSDYPHWLVLYPEGHRYDPTKVAVVEKVKNYALDHGLPTYKHLLTPRSKALQLCFDTLHPHSIDAVYDVTIAFSSTLPPPSSSDVDGQPTSPCRLKSPSYVDLYRGDMKIHVHIKRIPASQIPVKNEAEVQQWLFQRYQAKDQLLSNFFSSNPALRGKLGDDGVTSPLNLTRVLPYVVFYNATLLLALTSWQSFKIYASSFLIMGTGTCLVSSLRY